jgi:hypothetical protein
MVAAVNRRSKGKGWWNTTQLVAQCHDPYLYWGAE